MLSRAHLIIEQQIEDAKQVSDFRFGFVNDSVFEVVVQMSGQPGTLWEDGIFQVYIKFDENYNQLPPKVWLLTIPYHPNVNQSNGQPSLDFIDDVAKWRALDHEERSIKHLLFNIQQLLSNPLLDRAVNMDAVFMLKCNPVQYENIIRQSVKATHRLKTSFIDTFDKKSSDESEAYQKSSDHKQSSIKSQLFRTERQVDVPAKTYEPQVQANSDKKPAKSRPPSKMATELSFNDYMILWRDIGTTKASKTDENVYLKHELLEKPHLLQQHLSITLKDLEIQLNQQLTEHKNLMYGNLDFSRSAGKHTRNVLKPVAKTAPTNYNQIRRQQVAEDEESEFIEDSNQVKIVYKNVSAELDTSRDPKFENEVDELIKWTENLM